MAVISLSSAVLVLGLAAVPSTPSAVQSDHKLEAALWFLNDPMAGSFFVFNKRDIDALLSVTPPKAIDNTGIQFQVRADDFDSWRGDDWLP